MKSTYPCPVCKSNSVTWLSILCTGPMSKIRCSHCDASLNVSRTGASLMILAVSVAFPLGGALALVAMDGFSSFGLMTLAFLLGGLASCIPVLLVYLKKVKLHGRPARAASNSG